MSKLRQERDEYHRKYTDANATEDDINQRDLIISELQD